MFLRVQTPNYYIAITKT